MLSNRQMHPSLICKSSETSLISNQKANCPPRAQTPMEQAIISPKTFSANNMPKCQLLSELQKSEFASPRLFASIL
eukprot:c18097_g1_i2 orf=131-358(-)